MKRFLGAVLCAALALGCGKKKDDNNNPTPTPTPTAQPSSCTSPGTLTTGTNSLGGTYYGASDTVDPAGDVDYYTVDLVAGDWVGVFIQANTNNDPALLDAVITLYNDAGDTQLAQNDDSVTTGGLDSELFYHAPADGTYCIAVEDAAAGGDPLYTYDLVVVPLDFGLYDEFNEDSEPNDTPAAAQTVSTTVFGNNQIYTNVVGLFDSTGNHDVYQVDSPIGALRLDVGFRPDGTDGYGSTNGLGVVTLIDSDQTTQIAQLDGALGAARIYAPVVASTTYYLDVQAPGSTLGANPFYMQQVISYDSTNELELDNTGNNAPAGAEVATPIANGTLTSHFIGGTLGGMNDTDWWSFSANAGDMILVACASQRVGSGVRNAAVSVYDDPMGTALKTGNESATTDLIWQGADAIPVSQSGTHYLEISANTFDVNIQSRLYLCGIHVSQ